MHKNNVTYRHCVLFETHGAHNSGDFAGQRRSLSREVDGVVRPKILKATLAVAFCVFGGAMRVHQKLSKQDERELLQSLARRRQRSTPNHRDPAWMVAAYRRLTS